MPPKKKREETISRAAALLDIPVGTIYDAVKSGAIEVRELEGGTRLVDLDAVICWNKTVRRPGPGRPPSAE